MIDQFKEAWEDPARRARLLRLFWLISTGFTVFGFAVIFYILVFSR